MAPELRPEPLQRWADAAVVFLYLLAGAGGAACGWALWTMWVML
jgi:hypothetical protein